MGCFSPGGLEGYYLVWWKKGGVGLAWRVRDRRKEEKTRKKDEESGIINLKGERKTKTQKWIWASREWGREIGQVGGST